MHKWGGLGEVLEGNELIDSQLELKFRSDQERTTICEQTLDDKTARRFRDAVMRHYWRARARGRPPLAQPSALGCDRSRRAGAPGGRTGARERARGSWSAPFYRRLVSLPRRHPR